MKKSVTSPGRRTANKWSEADKCFDPAVNEARIRGTGRSLKKRKPERRV